MALKLRVLRPGARIALVSPASSFEHGRFEQGRARLEAMGYQAVPGRNALKYAPQYFAGTVEERLSDIHSAFADDSVNALLCNRGGYGSNMLLRGLDLDLVRQNPKPFIGHSDVTSMLTWMHDRAEMPVFHGPLLAGDFAREDGVDEHSWNSSLSRDKAWTLGAADGLITLKPGTAAGKLYGGCLPMLAASLGTPFEIQTAGTILFLEDVAAKPYQIDRMIVQLQLAGKFDQVRGVVFGAMMDCVSHGAPEGLLLDALLRLFESFDGPVAFGLRSGHVRGSNITLPLGVDGELDLTDEPRLHVQPAVE